MLLSMIRGVHTMFYTSEPEALRAFIRDKLQFPFIDVDGAGWLIFDLPEADMGCHPADEKSDASGGAPSGTHSISFYCDDIEKTVKELKSRGVEFIDGIENHGYGLVTHFKMPGDFAVQLYQPLYEK
jgi:catechol 2,3-dioxygenase-like lactoylglutathione lyase family enzyme